MDTKLSSQDRPQDISKAILEEQIKDIEGVKESYFQKAEEVGVEHKKEVEVAEVKKEEKIVEAKSLGAQLREKLNEKMEEERKVKEQKGFSHQEWVDFFKFLDGLRESGITNMFGAGAYVEKAFRVDRRKAQAIVLSWMETFGDGKESPEERAKKVTEGKVKEQEEPGVSGVNAQSQA